MTVNGSCTLFEACTIGRLNSHQFYTKDFSLLLWKHRMASANALQEGTEEMLQNGARKPRFLLKLEQFIYYCLNDFFLYLMSSHPHRTF